MLRLTLPTAMVLLFGLQVALAAAKAAAQEPQPAGATVADLKDQLESGLQARLPGEFAFIARVVGMVENGQLPIALVKSTFEWTRRMKTYKQSLVPYFKRALRLRAARLGIVI